MLQNLPIWLITAGFPIYFAVVWWGVLSFLAMSGGWKRLARQFPDDKDLAGVAKQFCNGQFGWVNYGNCLTVRLAPKGIYLSTFSLFRPGHPPMLIPWNEIHKVKERSQLFLKFVEMEIGDPRMVRIRLPDWVADYIPDSVSRSE
jgi:hypothetical protein